MSAAATEDDRPADGEASAKLKPISWFCGNESDLAQFPLSTVGDHECIMRMRQD